MKECVGCGWADDEAGKPISVEVDDRLGENSSSVGNDGAGLARGNEWVRWITVTRVKCLRCVHGRMVVEANEAHLTNAWKRSAQVR
jgi:Zn ribbon nucleic-acid-binding protein